MYFKNLNYKYKLQNKLWFFHFIMLYLYADNVLYKNKAFGIYYMIKKMIYTVLHLNEIIGTC